MNVSCISTGSSGNAYLINVADNYVLLDCGIKFEKITHHKDFPKFHKLNFVFVSHSHGDHNKSIKDFEMAGCKIISYETLEQRVQKFYVCHWECTTFPVAHNVPCWGILLKHMVSGETLCYITDAYAMPKVENVDTFIYEVNYIDKVIDKIIERNKEFKHTNFKYHNSLENAIEYFKSLKRKPKKIYCCHGSKEHSFKKDVQKQMEQFADEVIVL